MADASVPAQRVIHRLAVHLGPNVAKMAVGDFAKRALGVKPDEVTAKDIPRLLDAMRPMLSVLMGKEHSEAFIQELGREVS